ncbi:hypothetical protein RBU49_10015 [Clostridium sp. MB40-C1]|uniref:hypothetical protein n=1 Tax=Clostridium sp. MB40-C1 TaxID=3070996 RepID=UPI0027E0D4C8|nr:hypothetical protein [Clostridium sp. MB40-C1]WMJ79224.1 hypothetical protein RBU49_10015 [Clostridium sp. MB40-C1]
MKTLKKNLTLYAVFLIFAIGCFIYGKYVSTISEYIYGILFGFGVTGLVGLLMSLKLMRNPEKCEEIELYKNEERSVFIREKTSSKVYSIFIFIESTTIIILGFLGYKFASMIISALLLGKLVMWFILGTYYGKKY